MQRTVEFHVVPIDPPGGWFVQQQAFELVELLRGQTVFEETL
jgi:hypothetical protein